jgi:heat shock protein HslJ
MRRAFLFVPLLALALTACGDPAQQAASDPTTSAWALASGTLDGAAVPILDTHPITLVFDEDGNAGGTSACNSYFAGYDISANEISFSDAGQTMMACEPEEAMTSESTYLEALGRVRTFTTGADGFVLTGEDVELRFVVDDQAGS